MDIRDRILMFYLLQKLDADCSLFLKKKHATVLHYSRGPLVFVFLIVNVDRICE